MQDYEEFSQIFEADDSRFDEIWDEDASMHEEETKDSQPVVSATESETESEEEPEGELELEPETESEAEPETEPEAGTRTESEAKPESKSTSLKEAQPASLDDSTAEKSELISHKVAKPAPKPQREKVTISSITAENQSVVSTISKSTFISRSSTLDMTSVLVDSPLDREVSEITTTIRIQPMIPPEDALEGGVFLNLYESMVAEQALNMSRCANKEYVVENETVNSAQDERCDVINQDKIRADSKQANVSASKALDQENAPSQCKKCAPSQCRKCTPKTMRTKIFFIDSEPMASVPNFLASTAAQFVSSSLSVDDEISRSSIYSEDEGNNDRNNNNNSHEITPPLIWTDTDIAIMTPDLPAVTLEEKRLDERSLLDLLSTKEPQGKTVVSEGEPLEDIIEDLMEDENITEGLGLILPPPLQQTPKTAETKDQQETNEGKIESDSGDTGEIEVDEAGQISIKNELGLIENGDDQLRYYQEITLSPRDVYITHRIEAYESDDKKSLSPSQDCDYVHTQPKQNSGLKKFLKPRWTRRIKIFSGSRDKKNDGKTKTSKSIYDSPSRTVKTVATATTASSTKPTNYENMKFAAEFPVSRKSLPNFIRPKVKV